MRWSEDKPGEAVFYNPNEENVSFAVHCYRDDEELAGWGASINGIGEVKVTLYHDIFESGNYRFVVETFGYGVESDWDLSAGYVSETSPTFKYTRPSEQLETQKNISWSTDGVLSWDAVEHAESYWSYLSYANDSVPSGYDWINGFGWSGTYEDYSDEMASGYDYYARVRAVSENINLYANSDYSDWIAFDSSTTVDKANGKLDEAIGDGVTAENAQSVVTDVKNAFADDTAKGELQVAMQTDTETQEKIKNLEEAYKASMGLETAVDPNDDIGIDINKLTILHYNADGTYENLPVRKNSDGTISFTVTHFSNFVFGEKQSTSENTGSGSSNAHVSSGSGSSTTVSAPTWKPTTPDEIKRYSFVGKEKVNFIADTNNAYPVTIVNAMQGKLCFDVFEAVLGDYAIGRTYNIFPSKKSTYKMDSVAKITLSIPKALQGENREYKMICVTKNGQPIILEDMDLNPATITFETDSYYAFALVYKDVINIQ